VNILRRRTQKRPRTARPLLSFWTSSRSKPGAPTRTRLCPSVNAQTDWPHHGLRSAGADPSIHPSSTATSTSTTTTPSSTPTSTPITANPTSTPTPSTPNYQYYTPQGGPSGPGFQTLTSQHFWVVRADDGIELGWNDLPANTIEIIIYRSVSENGNWKNIFSQQYDTATRFIRLVDSSIGVTYYYKLEARNGNNALVATYGPEKLTAQ
jgi:hypothetical protein